MNTSKNFILFSNCILVKGKNRSTICDLGNNYFYLIPNSLYYILKEFNGLTLDIIYKKFSEKNNQIISEYFEFLVEKKLIFFTNLTKKYFPEIDLAWHSPNKIENSIIDFKEIKHNYKKILKELENLSCANVQIRFFRHTQLKEIEKILKFVHDKKLVITNLEFLLPYDDKNLEFIEELKNLGKIYPRMKSITLYKAPVHKLKNIILSNKIHYIKENIIDERNCGIIDAKYFTSNISLFTESQKYNTCLNKKIAIDKDGNIKNCPSMEMSFGNINNTDLEDVVEKKDFKKYWKISKNKIEICKNCEFRHICTDCRAYLEDVNNKYSKPLKCGYNPATNIWEDWSQNILKQKSILYYKLKELDLSQ
ncbi:grasp-with-spasm system SPASM domain peptide maturase [Aquimarina sp. ERC-38]|uniref:grasp-with-spasm system SPASM domain peptide maturase n=1 Tax=Aquimarina sp. ERC-38 TaxID=2949996 RepID=UPI0022480F86|nr:grasp-with-spasm system SPASM domain peptide maturase [Aquimarina sp. ERC-38]UZO81889.1 grasp-with-spasm system SPASM domain peptide maturase [Aquimarina sp. ERC-38]